MLSIAAAGSPPRMRGKLQYLIIQHAQARITPADAGKTRHAAARARTPRDHPRGCGENRSFITTAGSRSGSPPRMRGKLAAANGIQDPNRITPADAGKTGSRCDIATQAQDHPRGCGENQKHAKTCSLQSGSPPRMRGKLKNCSLRRTAWRITPADAGKTCPPP